MRRLATIALLAAGTAGLLLHWLHDGDLQGAVAPVLPAWGASLSGSLPGRVEQAVAVDETAEPAGPPPTLQSGVGGPVEAPGVSGRPEDERP